MPVPIRQTRSDTSNPDLVMMPPALSRRQFLTLTATGLAGSTVALTPTLAASPTTEGWDPRRPFPVIGRKLTVQPLLMYSLPTRREAASWKSWGGIQTPQAVVEEQLRIAGELKALSARAGFKLEVLPLLTVTTPEAAAKHTGAAHDVTLVYACTGSGDTLRACLRLSKDSLVFVRHRSGPVYYWYEALSTRYLQADPPDPSAPAEANPLNVHVDDVVVDDCGELHDKLKALSAVKNLLDTRIVALGGPWGKYAADAPQKAQERFRMKILDVSYEDFEPRLRRQRADRALQATADRWARAYLSLPHTRLRTERRFVVNAFVLYQTFKDLMEEQDASAFTIKSCMGTVIPMAETTACLSLALLNDEGGMAFCESDFVIIPAGILLRYLSGRPVFLHNSTFPHRGLVTCAHCTCPRRLDGRTYAPTQILTHYESDYGAAPKVDIPIGQEVTFIDPDYSQPRWLGFNGRVKDNPAYDICRSQQDVEIRGDWQRLRREVRDSHWVMAYGNHLDALGYAARKLGFKWVGLAGTQPPA